MKHGLTVFVMIGVLVIAVGLAATFRRMEGAQMPLDDNAKALVERLGCEYEVINNARDASVVMDKYKALLASGRAEGFTPIVLVPSDILGEMLEFALSPYDSHAAAVAAILEKSEDIDAAAFLRQRVQDSMPDAESGYDIMGEYTENEPHDGFGSIIDFANRGRIHDTIVIALIPTDKPWELAAWIPMGGFNACPSPEEQVAVFKYWYERYGAVPAAASYDIWELYTETPVSTQEDAMTLALEQYGFCGDIVWQGAGQVGALAGTLVNANTWYFWWD